MGKPKIIEEIDTLKSNQINLTNTTSEHTSQLAQNMNLGRITKLNHNFSNKANGNITEIDSKQVFGIYNNAGNTSGLAISNGKMVHGLPTLNNSAGYLEIALDSKVTRMGATFIFPDTSNPGYVTLATFAKSIVDEVVNKGNSIPDAGIHVTVTPTYISTIVYKGTGSTSLGVVYFDVPLTANRAYNIELFVDGQDLYVIMPDGSISVKFSNSEIESLSSKYATFELYEVDSTRIPAEIVNLWADDRLSLKNGNNITGFELVKALNTLLTVDRDGVTKTVTDLNNADKSGKYQCGQNTINAPSTSSLHFDVIKANSNYILQYAWQMSDSSFKYMRIKNNGTWGSWIACIESSNRLLTTDSSGNANLITDFNNATKTGFYQCNSGASNAPSASAQLIEVISANSLYKLQYAWQMTDPSIKYRRHMNNGTWGSWVTCTE